MNVKKNGKKGSKMRSNSNNKNSSREENNYSSEQQNYVFLKKNLNKH